MTDAEHCFHCALPIPPGCRLKVEIDAVSRPVCCPGCKAVAELIRDSGLASYYALREAPDPGVGRPPEDTAEWTVFDRDDMLAAFAPLEDGVRTATLYVGGMYCAACSWLIESTLAAMPGVVSAEVSPITHRLRLVFRGDRIAFSGCLARLAGLGYRPQPLSPDTTTRPEVVEQRGALKRLLVASLGMMQVMMFAVGLYAMDFQGTDPDMQHFLRLVSFFVTTPVVFYSARPFFRSAWRGVVTRHPGMDLPVSLAVGSAYAASVYATFTRGEAVWFDSVTMFVFFLTLGRFLEMRARHRSIDRGVALTSLLPNTATRVDQASTNVVPVGALVAGDVVRVRSGDAIPADGIVVRGETSVDESLLTGESRSLVKRPGDGVAAGSVNIDGLVDLRVTRTGNDTTLGTISRLSERARYARPGFVSLADKVAGHIVIVLLVVAAGVAAAWSVIDPARAFVVTLSVLVVTCPCALSLATPAAFAAAGARLSQLRLLITNGNAIESLSRATLVMFDKTGTLTMGMPTISHVEVIDGQYSEARCRDIASALEAASSHPLAHAFPAPADPPAIGEYRVFAGQGVSGSIDGRQWRLGSAAFAWADPGPADEAMTRAFLGVDGEAVARFDLQDNLRPDAAETIDALRTAGLRVELVSGDNVAVVTNVAAGLRIDEFHAGCSPEDKLSIIESAQANGERVVMVGDGINDAPVLAGADTSIAPAHGAMLAQTTADIIMLGESLAPLVTAVDMARRTMRIVRQNIAWAIVYNALALPFAAAGFVPPWLAAIGMSTSSLGVVLNALRLSRVQ